MKKNLFLLVLMFGFTTLNFAQLTSEDVNILFDGKTVGESADAWIVENDGTNHMSTLEVKNGVVVFNLNTNHASWYPNMGEFYPGGNLDCSNKNKLMIRVKLPDTPETFKIEPLVIAHKVVDGSAASYGWEIAAGDTVRLNSGDVDSSNSEFPKEILASGGDWQILEYEVQNWHSTFPATSVWMDSTKVIGIRVYYGFNTGDAPLQASVEVDWAVFVAPETTPADVEAFLPSGSSAVSDVAHSGGFVFPNPVSDILNVKAEVGARVCLISISGKNIETQYVEGEMASFDTKDLNKGIYFIQLSQGDIQKTEKVILY